MIYFVNLPNPVNNVLLKIIGMCLLLTNTLAQSSPCDLTQFESTPEKQFIATNLGTVLDTKTNLEWKVCMEGKTWQNGTTCIGTLEEYNWQSALEIANSLNTTEGFAGKYNWRLPNIKELATIFEFRCRGEINPNIFSAYPIKYQKFQAVWSSSPQSTRSYSWVMAVKGPSGQPRIYQHYVRLVRDAVTPR